MLLGGVGHQTQAPSGLWPRTLPQCGGRATWWSWAGPGCLPSDRRSAPVLGALLPAPRRIPSLVYLRGVGGGGGGGGATAQLSLCPVPAAAAEVTGGQVPAWGSTKFTWMVDTPAAPGAPPPLFHTVSPELQIHTEVRTVANVFSCY